MNTDLMPVYAGSQVPINKPGFRDKAVVAGFEAAVTTARHFELYHNPVQPTFDLGQVREIHRRLFQDVYPWAGNFRTAAFPERGTTLRSSFSPSQSHSIEQFGKVVLGEIKDQALRQPVNKEKFVETMVRDYDRLSYWRPFAHGNDRTLRIFASQMAAAAGYRLEFARTDIETLSKAVIATSYDELAPLRAVFRSISIPQRAHAFTQTLAGGREELTVQRHPELKSAFHLLSQARERLGYHDNRFTDPANEQRYDRLVGRIQRELDKGSSLETLADKGLEQLLWASRAHAR